MSLDKCKPERSTTVAAAGPDAGKDKISGEREEEAEWHRVVFYDRLAVIASEHLKNDPAVNADVRLRTRKYTYMLSIEKRAAEILLLGDREGGADAGEWTLAAALQRPGA